MKGFMRNFSLTTLTTRHSAATRTFPEKEGWIPEFAGDVVIVNCAPWPKFSVEPRRYRFHLLGGTNAHMYNLNFGPVPLYVVGSDDNYLNNAVSPQTARYS